MTMPAGTKRRGPRQSTSDREPPRTQLEAIIRGMYREMPGLSLQLPQAARLFGLCETTCRDVLDALVRRGTLRRAQDGKYQLP
jgi:DNA-binding IclR family transcriptional regulator